MTEQFNALEKITKQAERLTKGFHKVDEGVFHETFSIAKGIHDSKGLALPNHKIKFLLLSPDLATLKSRAHKLGKRFF